MGHSNRSLQDSAKSSMNYGGPTQRVFRGKQYKQMPWRPLLKYLAENMVTFCPLLKNLPEVTFKGSRLTSLAEEISNQPNTNSVV